MKSASWTVVDGAERALLFFKNGRVRMVMLPTDDRVLIELMGKHGVAATIAPPEPSPPDSPLRVFITETFEKWLPVRATWAGNGQGACLLE